MEFALSAWLVRGLKGDRHAKLDGTPVDPSRRVRLARVFTDVGVQGAEEAEPDLFARLVNVREESQPGVLVQLMNRGLTWRIEALRENPGARNDSHMVQRFVVVGGPGQGKSTLAQQLTQLHRAALLVALDMPLDEIASATMNDISVRAAQEGWPEIETVRLPFLVPLGSLSRWRVTRVGGEARFIDYLVEHVQQGGGTLSATELATLLRATPWLLVLDGLDEVPVSAGRRETLALVEHFLRELRDSPGMLVGTTRPHGYQNDFGAARELRLAEFSPGRALSYAKRLVEDWFADEPDDQRRLIERLTNAAQEEHTARLLGTPLHVTILSALLYRTPTAPRERWQLFHDFFDAIYQREVDRPHPYATLLKQYRRYIQLMHHQAGLHLQVLGEHAEGAEALLTREELTRIIDARLQDARFSDERRRALVAQIIDAASDRLVLLAQVQDGRYGFTLRSIQEFMAAEALTSGPLDQIEERVQKVVPMPYWRNVTLLAVSKAFAPMQTALAPLVGALTIGLCDWLVATQNERSAPVPGEDAELAMDMLAEGSVMTDPGVTHELLTRALSLLDQPDVNRSARLGSVLVQLARDSDLAGDVEAVARPMLSARLGEEPHESSGAWRATTTLADKEVEWGKALAAAQTSRNLETPNQWRWGLIFMGTWIRAEVAGTVPLVWSLRSARSTNVRSKVLAELKRYPVSEPDVGLVQFIESPSASALATTLTTYARGVDASVWVDVAERAPWPVSACLVSAESVEDLLALADASARGALGDVSDWLSAERRWGTQEIELGDIAPHGELTPFSSSISDKGFMPLVADPWISTWTGEPEDRESRVMLATTLGEMVVRVLRASDRRAVARWAGRVLDALSASNSPAFPKIPVSLLRRILGARRLSLGALLRAAEEAEEDALITLVDEHTAAIAADEETPTDEMTRLLARHPTSPGLLRLALDLLPSTENIGPIRIPGVTYGSAEQFSPPERAVVAALAFAHRRTDANLAQLATVLLEDEGALWSALNIAGERPVEGARLATEVLRRLAPTQRPLREHCIAVLTAERARLRSGLLVPDTWTALGLPRPSPPEPTSSVPVAPVYIRSVHIENLRAFDVLDLSVAPPDEQRGAWVVLLGENGTGKSTVLRAITLALAEPDYASAMFTESSSRALYRRDPSPPAHATVDLGGQTYTAAIETGDGGRETLRTSSDPPNGAARERPFVVAYGCRRGTADGGRDQKVVVDRLDDIGTLFDAPGRALVIAEAWLKDLALAHFQNEVGAAHIYEVVRHVLVGDGVNEGILPGVRSMKIAESVVWFEGPDVGKAPLAALSDGYITTTGWVIDLMARWVKHCRTRQQAVPRNFTREMRGVVLIDEIDLHLHPRWQRDLIPSVRRVFPNLTFVVTTHNPLTVIGARDGEVFVLRRRESRRVEARPLDLPVGLRADQVLTGEWFGLATTLDPETFALWERHYRALRSGLKAGDPSLHEMERELAKRLGTYASTSVDRIALDVAAEVMGDHPQDMTPEERSVARDRILAWVKARTEGSS